MSSLMSTALIPYGPLKTPMEFIRSEAERWIAVEKMSCVDIELPEKMSALDMSLFPLHRQIERQYLTLPWPAQIQKIVVLTQVNGGRGDIVAAAKTIDVMQRMCSTLTFDWVLQGARYHEYIPSLFLDCLNPSKVNMRNWKSLPQEDVQGDFLLAGPVGLGWGVDYIETGIRRKIVGPVFSFLENAQDLNSFVTTSLPPIVQKDLEKKEMYQELHTLAFPSSLGEGHQLPMGLQPGSGVFLDRSRMGAALSRGDCCPSYLLQIEGSTLRKDILEAMNVFDGQSQPDYDQYSFNSGYAHHPVSWGKFIDCVAIHEKNKHVVIVLNQKGEFADLSDQEFQDKIFGEERLAFLKEKGYGDIFFKGKDQSVVLLQHVEGSRRLTVIVRPSFFPSQMKYMQLASERLLATGDNSAVEAWCARCKLYLYEDVANMGCKWRFLQQQVDLAQTISPNLSKLLALFGGDARLSDPCLNKPLNRQKMDEVEQLLNDPSLSDSTLQFCSHITSKYSFDKVLEAAIKRTVWHHCIPELAKIESETIDEDFQTGLIAYFKDLGASEKVLHVRGLPELGRRVQGAVQEYLLKQ
jgi:hypothetical protein